MNVQFTRLAKGNRCLLSTQSYIRKTIIGIVVPLLTSRTLEQTLFVFTIGLNGILIIPIDVVVHYNRFSGWKGEGKKGRQYHVRIKHNQDGTLTFWNFNDPNENIDITQYLIGSKL